MNEEAILITLVGFWIWMSCHAIVEQKEHIIRERERERQREETRGNGEVRAAKLII